MSGQRNLRGVQAEVDEHLSTAGAREQYLLEAVGRLAHADEATLTERQRSLLNECTALAAEKLLGGDERFVGRLLRSDATLAARLINKLHDTVEMLSSLGTAESNREYTRLREAEELFLSAVENAGMTYRNGKIAVTDDGEKEEEAEAFTDAEKQKKSRETSVRPALQLPGAITNIGSDDSIHQNEGVVNPSTQKKSRETSVSPALQLPGAITNIDSDNSIHQNGDVVNTISEKKVQYSKKPFSKQVDDVLGGADVISTHLKLMQTPQILREAGLPDLPLLMTARHLKTITASFGNYKANYHGLDTELVKKLPQYLSSPVMIADSLTRSDSVVIVTEALDAEARPVIAAVLLNGNGRFDKEHIQANIMTSAYGKDNIQSFIDRLSESGAVLYWNEKKCRELAEYLELRLPKALTDIVPDTVVRRTAAFTDVNKQRKSRQPSVKPELQLLDIVTDIDSDNSIHQNEGVVNPSTQKKSRETSVNPELQLLDDVTDIDSNNSIHQNGDVVNTNFEKKVQYSKKPFPKQVDDVLGGADVKSTHLKLMQTPQILREAGLPDLPLLMTARHLKTITASFGNYKANYHGLDTELVKKLPQYLSSPVMIADSLTRSDSMVIVTEALDAEARPVIAAVLLNGKGSFEGNYIDANIMTSAYGKDNIQSFIDRLSESGAVLYWNEKKCRELAEYLELRLPKALTDIVPDTVVRRTAAFTDVNKQKKSRKTSVNPELQLLDIVTDIDSDNSIHQNGDVVNTISEKNVRLSKKIFDDMSETQRAEVLKEYVIIPSEVSLPDSLGVDYEALENGAWKQVKKALTERLRELDCLTLYESRAADVDFRFTGEGLRKSANSQLHDYGGSLADLSTVVTNLKPLIDNAVLLESHSDKARGTPRENGQLLRTYVLLSAYYNEGGITPVQLEIKQYVDDNNRPYLAVALTKTEADVVNDTASEAPMPTRLVPASAISIPQLISKINPADENFFKYVPNEFLTAEQLAAKQNALAREARKYQKKSRETSVSPALQLHDAITDIDSNNSIHQNGDVVNTISEKKVQFSKSSDSERKRLTEGLMKKLNALNDAELGKFSAASVYKNDSLERAMNVMTRLARKETVGASELRAGMRELRTWYGKENKLLGYENDGNSGFYREDIAEKLDTISEGKSRLSVDELSMMNDVVAHLTKILQTWDKTYRDGRWQDTKTLAGEYLKVLKRSEGVRAGMAASLASSRLQRQFGDPASVFRAADKYEPHGFFTESFEQLRRAAVNTDIMKMELKESYESFLREHKDYKKRLTAEATYMGKRLSVGELISLYLTHDRPQAFAALVENGVVLESFGKKGSTVTELEGIAGKRDRAYGADELRAYIEESKRSIEAQLTPVDREFIAEVRKIYAECAAIKHDTDIERFGYSSISEHGAYYPLRRYDVAKSLGGSDYMREADSASGMSFNRRTVKSRARLLIEPVQTVLERHVGGISLYANFSSTAEGLSRILNADTSDGGGVPRSLLSELKRTEYYRETLELLRTLSRDVEGKRQTSDKWYTEKVRFIRSSYAKYQLGANPKVLTSQWSSLLAAGSILDYSSVIEGMRVPDKLAEVDEYCSLAKLRNTDNTVIKAETVTDKVGKAGELLMYHIGYMDRRVIAVLFGACQVQVQKDAGLKLGTAKNKKAAGELLERVILETQQNYIATERSAAMRSSDELLKGLVMFSADSMKVTGRVIDAFGECSVLRARLRAAETTGADVKKMRIGYDKARKKAARAASSLMASAVFLASMSLTFKGLYGKLRDEEERDEAFGDFVADIFGNMLGGMPIVRDVYSALVEGYDMDTFLVGSFNDLVNSFGGIAELAQNALNGKDVTRQQAARGIRSVAYALGQLFGVPVRNIFNVATGIPSGISAEADYRIEDTFYKKSYSADLKDAVDKDDEKLQEIITGLMLREAGDGYDSTSRSALSELLKQGYSVLPQSIGDTVSRNGETVELERSEQKRLREGCARAQAEINSLTHLSAFRNAAPDVQARAIRLLNGWYYTMALSEVLGDGEKSKAELFAAGLELYKLALIIATAESLEAERDSSGRPISGSKKSKVMEYIEAQELTAAQKHMVAGWLGYRNSKGEDKVRAYIATLALSREEKSRLLQYSGYAA